MWIYWRTIKADTGSLHLQPALCTDVSRHVLNGPRVLRPSLNGPREASSSSHLMNYYVPANLIIGYEECRTCPFFMEFLQSVVLYNGIPSSQMSCIYTWCLQDICLKFNVLVGTFLSKQGTSQMPSCQYLLKCHRSSTFSSAIIFLQASTSQVRRSQNSR